MNKIRKIIYTYDFKSYFKRYAGETFNVIIDGLPSKMEIERIEEEPNPKGIPRYLIYVRNERNEVALWKTVKCENTEVEHDIYNLLKP